MSSPTVRCDYDAMSESAQAFGQEADGCERSLNRLLVGLDTLRSGDWLGQRARAFYQEMDSDVVPTLKRLVRALQESSSICRQLGQTMKQAEDEAASYFRAEVNGASPAPNPGSTGGVKAFGPLGGGSAAANKPAAPSPAPAGASSAARPSDKFLKSFGNSRLLIMESPTLLAQLTVLESMGFRVVLRPDLNEPAKIDAGSKEILIRPNSSSHPNTDSQIFLNLAGAIGHLLAPSRQIIVANPTEGQPKMTKDDFVRLNVNQELLAPASEMLNVEVAKAEYLANTKIDLKGPAGYSPDEIQQIHRIRADFRSGKINRDQAVQSMANVFGNHTVPGTSVSNWEWTAQRMRRYWDTHAEELGWE